MVIGGALAAVSEAFALARKAGVDPALVRQALLGGFAASRVLEVHGERILNSNYKPGFRANLYAKDLRIAANTLANSARRRRFRPPCTSSSKRRSQPAKERTTIRRWAASWRGSRGCEKCSTMNDEC
jgi:3-hydroxyisobutyrate dehydrogenase-like beta-hydroxyacid dehydrogenase